MEKVRTILAYDSSERDRELKKFFVYRGYFAREGGRMAWHVQGKIRSKRNIFGGYLFQDDVFTMAETTFDTPEYFKEVIDNHYEYIERAFPSAKDYFALNS